MPDVDELRVKVTMDASGVQAGLERMESGFQEVGQSADRAQASVNGTASSVSGITKILGTMSPQVKKMERTWNTSMSAMQGATEGVSLAVAAMGVAAVAAVASAAVQMATKIMDFWKECVELADPDAYDEATARLDKSVEDLKSAIGTLTSGAFRYVMEWLANLLDSITETINSIISFLQRIGLLSKTTTEAVEEMVEATAGLAAFDRLNTLSFDDEDDTAEAQEEAAEAQEEAAEAWVEAIKDAEDALLAPGLDKTIGGVGKWLDDVLGTPDFGGLWAGFKDWCGDVGDYFGGLWAGFTEWGGEAWDAIAKFGGDVWSGICNVGGDTWKTLTKWGGDLWESFKSIGGTVWDTLCDIGGTVWDTLTEWGGALWDAFKGFGETVWNGICDIGTTVWNVLTDIGGTLWDAFSNAASGVWNWIKEKGSSVIDAITGFFWDCVSWIYTGLATVYNWLVDVYNALADALNGFLGIFGLHIGHVEHVDTNFTRPGQSSSSDVDSVAGTVADNMAVATSATMDYLKEGGGWSDVVGSYLDNVTEWSQDAFGQISSAYSSGAISDSEAEDYLGQLEEEFYEMLRHAVEFGAASGDVIAPGDYQLRMVGDNLRETEVISPLSTMREAFLAAIEEAGLGNNGGSTTVELTIDGKKLARAIYDPMRAESRRRGAGAWRREACWRCRPTAGTRAWPTRSTSPT